MTTTSETPTSPSQASQIHGTNWMLILICLITALTALWEAFGGGSDRWGYLLTGVGMALFAVQNFIWPRSRTAGDRLHIPAVALTLIGVVLLVLSNTTGRRI